MIFPLFSGIIRWRSLFPTANTVNTSVWKKQKSTGALPTDHIPRCDRGGGADISISAVRGGRAMVALILARAVWLGIRCADGNNQMAIWGRRCRSLRSHEARRNNRGHTCPLLVGIATGRAGMDHVYRGAHLVLDQGRSIRVWRNGRRRQKKHRVVRGAA